MKKKVVIILFLCFFIMIISNMSFASTDGGYTIADSQSMLLGGNSFTIKVQMASTGNTTSDFALIGQANKFDPTKLNCIWSVSPSDIVTISNRNGGTCTLTAKKVGTTKLKCLIYKTAVQNPQNVVASLESTITVTNNVSESDFSPKRFR